VIRLYAVPRLLKTTAFPPSSLNVVVVGDGAVVVLLGVVRVTATVVGNGVFRIASNRFVVVSDGAVEVTLVAVRGTAVRDTIAAIALGK
jgi:hypothetical protein